jgi:D-alanyl-D-alanine carboxypeptidase
MKKNIEANFSTQSLLLTLLFTILSCLLWGFLLVLIIKNPAIAQLIHSNQSTPVPQSPTSTISNQAGINNTQISIDLTQDTKTITPPTSTITPSSQDTFHTIVRSTADKYDYPLFFYPVSQKTRLPEDYPTTDSQLPLVSIGEVSVAEILKDPLNALMDDAKSAGFSPYLRSGFRSINDQYTAYSRYVTEATTLGLNLDEAREYAARFSAEPGYSEHHLGLAVDLLDYFYSDWSVARNNHDKGLYLWLQQHAHEYGFVISYPAGEDPSTAKPGSGYDLSEPWHIRYVGNELAAWLFQAGYLDPLTEVTVNEVLKEAYLLEGNTLPIQ